MIASGLCIMGGCFAQGADGSAADTYWPAHSVHVYSAAVFSTPHRMVSVLSPDYCLFGRIENASRTNTAQRGQTLYWGSWDGRPYHTLFLGVKQGAEASLQSSLDSGFPLNIPSAEPVQWQNFSFKNNVLSLSCESGTQSKDCTNLASFDNTSWVWYSKVQNLYSTADVCAYAYYTETGASRFCIQPMRSASGSTAFYDVDNNELIEQ